MADERPMSEADGWSTASGSRYFAALSTLLWAGSAIRLGRAQITGAIPFAVSHYCLGLRALHLLPGAGPSHDRDCIVHAVRLR